MTLAGGCGAGAIWRAGEGQVKLWLALLTFALGASLTRLALAGSGALGKLGWAVFLPSTLGWGASLALTLGVLIAWAALATWNEDARVVSALD
ncbi:MAG TPA: YeeE/YedE thiosulfate transporter family protein [Methylomirabilota bacterium]|nr:YeeE/YedE thiosulfate transporter family protein [Methylomirabilota bacterium]